MALTLTGLSRESARFQSRSTFTGAGFTTSESEQVVGHPRLDAVENVKDAKANKHQIRGFIRSQGDQHNGYWKALSISNGVVTLSFFGHIRGFGVEDQTFAINKAKESQANRSGTLSHTPTRL